MDDLDKEPERHGHRFERYADDCNILNPRVNAARSAVDRPWNRKFLGYSMASHLKPELKAAAQANS